MYVRAALAAHVVLVGQRQAPGFESVWLRVSHNCLALDGHDLLVGAVYASPGSSSEHRRGGDSHVTEKSAAQAIFGGLLLAAITDFQLPTDTLLLAGDFNARVGTLHGDAALVHNHLDELARLTSGVPPPGPDAPSSIVVPSRSTQDTGAPSAFGRALMALADAADLVVLNGRADGDLHGALFTSKAATVGVAQLTCSSPSARCSLGCAALKSSRSPVRAACLAPRPVWLRASATTAPSACCWTSFVAVTTGSSRLRQPATGGGRRCRHSTPASGSPTQLYLAPAGGRHWLPCATLLQPAR